MSKIKLCILILFLFLHYPKLIQASSANHVVISEVQIENSTATDEFVELYNPTGADINLTGWRLSKKTFTGNQTNLLTSFPTSTIKAGGYFLIGHNDYKGATTADAFYSLSSASLAKDNTVLLYSDSGKTLVDKLGFGTTQDKENNAAPNPGKKESLKRKPNTDTDNNLVDFFLQTSPNPSNTNSSKQSQPQTQAQDSPSTTPTSTNQTAPESSTPPIITAVEPKPGDVMINEFLPNAVINQKEWIELYNTTNDRISLSEYFFEESSGKKIALYDFLEADGSNKFLVIDIDSGYLNNDGDIIILKNKTGIVIDKVAYGDFNDGNVGDNAETPPKDLSVARIKDGINTSNNARDFKLTFTKTKGLANIIYTGKDRLATNQDVVSTSILNGKIILNEILPNPLGNDKDGEFIELKNITKEEIDLNLLQISTNTGKYIINNKDFLDTKIKPSGFFLLPAKITHLTLSNSNDNIKLYEEKEKSLLLIDNLNYENPAKNNLSYSKIGEYNLGWTAMPTPGQENLLIKINEAPKAIMSKVANGVAGEEIIFDASASFDPEGDDLKYSLDFGDGNSSQSQKTAHAYNKPGNYKVALTVTDVENAFDKKEFIVRIKDGSMMPIKNEELVQYVEQQNITSSTIKTPTSKITQVNGQISRTRGRNVYIIDGDSEIRVYFQESNFPNYPKLYKGDLVSIAGTKDKVKNGYRILPRNQDDIVINSVRASGLKNDVLSDNAFGKKIELTDETTDQQKTENNSYKYYFYITFICLAAVLGGVYYDKNKIVKPTPENHEL